MDIHRCRFVPYKPQSINALAFSHPSSIHLQGRGSPTLRLAVGRANGDIEIWNPLRGTWFQETILRGGKDRSIEGLAWTLDPSERIGDKEVPGKLRLFSIGYSSVVTEWDLEQGRPARHSSGNYGEIWCLAAQPRWKATKKGIDGKPLPAADGEYTGQYLVAGCADGAIIILSTEDGDLKYLKTLRPSTKRARVLSIAFQNRHTVVAGYADSSIRVFDIRNGKLLRTISLGKGQTKDVKELLVWSIKCLPDGSIVSGDSAGEIRFWDGKNYSLVQRLQGHQADVLDIAISGDGESVMSGGADQRTVVYRLKRREKGVNTRRWAEIMHRRYHTHDVKALAVYETLDISIAVSGGLDTIPIVIPLREYGREHHRKLPNLPQVPQLCSSGASRLIMSWWDREVNIWRVSGSSSVDAETQHKLIAKVLFQGDEHLTSAILSQDGTILIASTVLEVKMFSLTPLGDELKVRKIDLPSKVSSDGARELAISPNGQWLCLVRPNNEVYLANLVGAPDASGNIHVAQKLQKVARVQRAIRSEKILHGTLGGYDRTVRCIAFSGDSKVVACGDMLGFIDTWILQDSGHAVEADDATDSDASSSDEDSDEEDVDDRYASGRWRRVSKESPLPRLNSAPLFLSFRPVSNSTSASEPGSGSSSVASDKYQLMAVNAEHHLSEFNVLQGKYSDWSRRNPKAYLPDEFTMIKDRAMGAIWDFMNGRNRLWLYGATWLWMFDLSQDFPQPYPEGDDTKALEAPKSMPEKKRKRRQDEEGREDDGKKRKQNTGAGDRIPLSETGVGFGKKMRKVVGDKAIDGEWVSLDTRKSREQSSLDDGDDDHFDVNDGPASRNESNLAAIRRDGSKQTRLENAKLFSPEPDSDQNPDHKRQWWSTFKYREILGIVPLSQKSQHSVQNAKSSTRETAPLEVVVVERPIWDLELPGRYIRDYE
ncbi:U3 small nucleolar RNA-associated protein [Myotisia sp. PD_48]|nr:U3 small nucleolar RNA-associated protein [Myotisia sp. PD_48]